MTLKTSKMFKNLDENLVIKILEFFVKNMKIVGT